MRTPDPCTPDPRTLKLLCALLAGASLSACAPRIPDCEADETYDADGNCIPRDTSLSDAIQQIYDAAPACQLLDTGDRLDLRGGCADEACAEDTYATMVDVLGPAVCEDPDQVDYGMIRCEWQDGALAAYIWDENGDNEPGSNEANQGLHLVEPWDGSDDRGLGLTVSLACFIDVYGDTSSDELWTLEDGTVYGLSWTDRGIYVHDLDLDGRVDLISIFGVY